MFLSVSSINESQIHQKTRFFSFQIKKFIFSPSLFLMIFLAILEITIPEKTLAHICKSQSFHKHFFKHGNLPLIINSREIQTQSQHLLMGLLINFPASLELTELLQDPPEACHLFCISVHKRMYTHILEPLGWQNKDIKKKNCSIQTQIQECRADCLNYGQLHQVLNPKKWGWGNKINPKTQNLFIYVLFWRW